MNILFYVIFGFLFWEAFHMFIWEWFKKKYKLDEKKVKAIFIFISIALVISIIGSGLYKVQSYENIVLTNMWGTKKVISDVGIKYSLLSDRESIDLRKSVMKVPRGSDFGELIITKDNKPLEVSALFEYQIKDVSSWAIENKETEIKLYNQIRSEVMREIQESDYFSLKEKEKESVENSIKGELKNLESIYGFETISLKLVFSDTPNVRDAKTNAESDKIKSNSLIESYKSEAEAIQAKYNAIDDKDFIRYLELMKAIENGDIKTIVLPENLNPVLEVA